MKQVYVVYHGLSKPSIFHVDITRKHVKSRSQYAHIELYIRFVYIDGLTSFAPKQPEPDDISRV